MRKIATILIFTLMFCTAYSQKDSIAMKTYSITFGGNYGIGIGDNFLSKGYKNNPGINLEFQFHIKRWLFLGFDLQQNFLEVKDQKIIGQFSNSDCLTTVFFAGYRQNYTTNNFFSEYRIGIGSKKITNHSILGTNFVSGINYQIATKLFYNFNTNLNFFTGFEFNYSTYDVDLKGPYKDFYSNSYQFTPTIGLRLNFGKLVKNKN